MGMTRIRNRGEGMQLEIRGATVDVTVSGDSGRGVLLLHGFMCSAQMMSSVQEARCGQMRVAALDFPGHGKNGRSAPPPKPWGVPDYMEMTAEVIRRLKLAPCDIVAHSFGARVAILLAATYPELVGRMILTGAAGIKKPKTGGSTVKQRVYKGLRAPETLFTNAGDGAGLGLAMARQIARLHGGELTVVSEKGKGSAFTARFPMQ